MKYLKLFESYEVDGFEYPSYEYSISKREEQILKDLVGNYYLDFDIKKDDGYYYTKYDGHYKKFDSFNELKDYLKFKFFIWYDDFKELLELIKVTKLDLSFDDNLPIRWASNKGNAEAVKFLLKDPRVDPSDLNNDAIRWSSKNGNFEIVKLLLEDPRVRAKLSPREINKYLNETS